MFTFTVNVQMEYVVTSGQQKWTDSHFSQLFNPSEEPAGIDLIINDSVVNVFVWEEDQHRKPILIRQL